MPVTALHHFTIRCTPDELPPLVDFYTRVMRLEVGARPEIPAPGAWLYADGQPIVLMADRQTTGGYPKIASVASVDLPLLAQRVPGETLRFAPVTLDEAQALYLEREGEFARVRNQIPSLNR